MISTLADIIIVYIGFSVFGLLGFLSLFNLVRAYRYDKVVYRFRESPRNNISYAKTFVWGGIPFNILYAFFLFMHPKPWGYLLAGLWIGFQIAFFYWYWHTKEDPLNRFHHEQKIWEDPRDKKKKEPK